MVRASEESPLRRISAEACLLGGAGYTVLLQVAHPSVARGMYDHSDFSSRPFRRMLGTLCFVYGAVYGTEEEKERLRAVMRAVHRGVTGPGYRALDHDLLLWVAATLYESSARLHAMVFGEPGEEERALHLREASVLGTTLGLPEEEWPAAPAEFDAYWNTAVARLHVSREAREVAKRLFQPRSLPMRPLMKAQSVLTGGLLPPDLREQFGLPWSEARQRRFDRTVRVTRAVYPYLPRPVRVLPATLCLWSMRRGLLGPRWAAPPLRPRTRGPEKPVSRGVRAGPAAPSLPPRRRPGPAR